MLQELQYPLLLVHGMGFRDDKRVQYWGRIPQYLQQAGAQLYYGGQDSNASVEENARQLAAKLDEVLAITGAPKVNIIAHSKGGLEARYLISTLGYADKVASLTTLSTPHHGSVTVDKLLRFPAALVRFGCKLVDVWFWLLGDKKPATYKAILAFQTQEAKAFNEQNPDAPQVYYQSYAFIMKKARSDGFIWFPYLIVKHFEGANDGLLAPRATEWTNFRGVYTGTGRRGISHLDEIDFRRRPLSKKNMPQQPTEINDIVYLYTDILRRLAQLGY